MAKVNKAEDTRQKAKQMRLQQQRKERRIRNIIIAVVGVVVIAVIATVVGVVMNSRNSTASQSGVLSKVTGDQASAILGNYAEGAPVVYSHLGLGEADPDLPTVTEYFDYTCPHCAEADVNIGRQLSQDAADGKINLEYQMVDTQRRFYTWADPAGTASLIVAQKDPDNWSEFHHLLMSYFYEQLASSDDAMLHDEAQSLQTVKELATQVGVPEDVVSTFVYGAVDDYLTTSTTAWTDATYEGRGDSVGSPEYIKDHQSVLPLTGNSWDEIYQNFTTELGYAAGSSQSGQ